MSKGKVLVAMSGGVDSSTVAAKLLDEGYEVEGATLDFGKFCNKIAIIDAQNVARQLNIKHHVVSCENSFEDKVIKYFVNDYLNGKTPNPCVKCNREIKFFELLKLRKEIEADYLATGHYAKITKHNEMFWLEKAADKKKDQSYFLGQLKYDYLQYIKFPLENIEKTEVRAYAKTLGLSVADKAESQDICFTKGKSYKDIISKYYKNESGDILLMNGTKLGEHNGIANYTQGQRKGLRIGYTEPLYVISTDPVKNIVYVGLERELYKTIVNINKINILDLNLEFNKEYEFEVKLRSTNNSSAAKVTIFNQDRALVELKKPTKLIASGQLCCIYNKTRIVASGYII